MSDIGWSLKPRIFKRDSNISGSSNDRSVDDSQFDRDVDTTQAFVERAQVGDREAFGALYKEHHGAIYRLARFYLGAAAEDVVGETFLRAWKALPRYRATGAPFVSWLYGIARHVVADELRKGKRSEPREVLPEQEVHKTEDDRLALNAAIAQLSDEQRKVIEMKYLLGMRNPEVAQLLGKSIGAVNAMQGRALAALKNLMEEER